MGYVSSFGRLQSTAEQGRAPCEVPSRTHVLDPLGRGKVGPRLLGQVCFWLLVSVFLRESCSVLLSLLRWAAAALLQLLRGVGGRECKKPGVRERERQAAAPQPVEGSPGRTWQALRASFTAFWVPFSLPPEFYLSAQPARGLGWGRARSCSLSQGRTPRGLLPCLEVPPHHLERATDSMTESHRTHQGTSYKSFLGDAFPDLV